MISNRSLSYLKAATLSLPVAFAALSPTTALADVIGGEVSVMYWGGAYGGDVVDRNTKSKVDFKDDLKFDDSGFVEFSAALEHPVPVIPNVRIKHIAMDETANGSLGVEFDGITFTGAVKTDLDLTHTSAALYYEILDNYVSVDIGLEAKIFDGQLRIQETSTGEISETKIDDPIPLGYVAASVELPLTGLSVGADVSAISYSGNKLVDAQAGIRYDISLAFIYAGYRTMMITVDDVSGVDVDADISGAYITTGIDF